MTDKPRIKYNQIPAIALEDVGRRMTHGHDKGHGDYKERLLEVTRLHFLDHAVWHINQFKSKGEKYTGSGDSHILAAICDLMMFYESELERGMLIRGKKVNKEEG